MNYRSIAWGLLSLIFFVAIGYGHVVGDELASPDGKFRFSIELKNGQPHYQVFHGGKIIIEPSRLGFRFASPGIKGLTGGEIDSSETLEKNTIWKPLYGERSEVRDHFNSQTFTGQLEGGLDVSLEVRCYNEGVAFCYHFFPADHGKEIVIESELTEFAFSGNHVTWATETAQGEYQKMTVSEMSASYDRPQIFYDQKDQLFIAIGEARLVDFARMKLISSKEKQNCVAADLSSEVKFSGDFKSPWRFVMAGNSPGDLLESNDLLLNLSDPCAIEDTSWIKPGKIIREVTLTSEGAYACIDFAAEHGFDYMLFDAGWYGDEYDEASDATTVTIDRKRSSGEIDMPAVIKYAGDRGIGIIVYVNRRALEKQLDEILPLYKKWGIAGVKYGFVNVGSQRWTKWLHDAIRKAADHQLMLNIHDEYRPTGYSRTYPNLMTQEGIGGDETSPTAKKTLGILFPRSIAGAGDQTICYYAQRVDNLLNHAFQLGKTVCHYSPWQVIYWYDRPLASPKKIGGAGGGHGTIGNEPELEFFDHVPTAWDDTKVLAGAIEEYAVIARRSGEDWWIGAMNAERPNQFRLKMDFLDAGWKYTMRSYTHDEATPTRTKVKIEETVVDADSLLLIDLNANDGAGYHLTPVSKMKE